MDAVMKQKVENDAAAYLRSICDKRGRNSALAETAVRESKSFTEREALDQKLIDLIAPGERQLLAALDGRTVTRFDGTVTTLHTAGAEIVEYQRTLRQRIISAIADPNIALMLLVIGALGIYVEFSSPGLIAPGVFGANSGAARPVGDLRAAHQLAGRGAAAAGVHALRAGGEVHLARSSGSGRRGGDGAGRGDAGGQPAAGDAHSLEHGARADAAVFGDHGVPADARGARAAEQGGDRGRGHDRGDRRGVDRTSRPKARYSSAASIGTRSRRSPVAAGARVQVTAIDRLTADGGACRNKETTMNDLSPVPLIFVIIVGIWLLNSIKILREYERGVIFRLGRLLSEPKGPG